MVSCAKMPVEQSNFYSNREINLLANFYFWNHKELCTFGNEQGNNQTNQLDFNTY